MRKKHQKTLLALTMLFCSKAAFAVDGPAQTHRIGLGPEAYWLQRVREGGTHQKGWLAGIEGYYQRLKKNSLYWAVTSCWAQGPLKGKTRSGEDLESKLTDFQIEGRLGYTWQMECRPQLSFTPFGGYGYFLSKNYVAIPEEFPVHYRDTFEYVTGGLQLGANLTPRLELQAMAQAKMPLNGKSHISNDPYYDPITLSMENEWQWRAELDFNYRIQDCSQFWASFTPFYEYRHYGGKKGYPYDFIDTKFQIWGLELTIFSRF